MDSNKHLNPEERANLLALLEKGLKQANRDETMLFTALSCGLRAQELLNLRQSDLNYSNLTIYVRTLKKGNPRIIPAPKELFVYASSVSSDLVFPISYPRLIQIWNVFKPCRKKFHSLRHTFAMAIYKKRKDINLVKHSLGHKSLSSTTVYLEETYKIDYLRKTFGLK